MNRRNNNLAAEGIDYTVIWLYGILVSIGVLCIFMVEYKAGSNWLSTFLGGKANYSKQLIFGGVCALVATFILLTDSKIFTAFANLSYLLGILLMLATLCSEKISMGLDLGSRLLVVLICSLPNFVKYLHPLQSLNSYPVRKLIFRI